MYAFGVVLLEVLTGAEVVDPQRPLCNRNLVDWLYSRLHDIAQVKEVGEPSAPFASSSSSRPCQHVIMRPRVCRLGAGRM